MQKLAIRLIFNVKRRQSITEIFKREEIIKSNDIHNYLVTQFMHKLYSGNLPRIFSNMFKTNADVHQYPTRQHLHYHIPVYKTAIGNDFIRKTGVIIWNDIVGRNLNNVSLGQIKSWARSTIIEKYVASRI